MSSPTKNTHTHTKYNHTFKIYIHTHDTCILSRCMHIQHTTHMHTHKQNICTYPKHKHTPKICTHLHTKSHSHTYTQSRNILAKYTYILKTQAYPQNAHIYKTHTHKHTCEIQNIYIYRDTQNTPTHTYTPIKINSYNCSHTHINTPIKIQSHKETHKIKPTERSHTSKETLRGRHIKKPTLRYTNIYSKHAHTTCEYNIVLLSEIRKNYNWKEKF